MHVIKCGSKDIKNVLGEAAREHESKVGTIDPERTHLNYNLAPEHYRVHSAEDAKERIKALGVTRKIRDDAVLSYSVIIDLPADYTGDQRWFFESAYRALTQELCQGDEDRVLQAYVHLDEKTPHMHYASVPVIEKDGKMKLSAKDILGTKAQMRSFHPHIEQMMTEDLGMPIHLYDPEKVAEREEARAKGDRSKDYVSLEEYKATKEKEALAKEMDKRLSGMQADLQVIEQTFEQTSEGLDKLNEERAQTFDELHKIKEQTASAKQELSGIITQGRTQIAQMNGEIEKTREYLGAVQKKAVKAKEELTEMNSTIEQKKTLIDTFNDALANLFTRFNKAYIALQKIVDHWFNSEEKTYLAICDRMREPVKKGNEAMNTLFKANQTMIEKGALTNREEEAVKEAHANLAEATEELEEIEDDYDYEM